MKQTEIYYRKISPNVIKITKIENALSLSKIRMQFGDDVTEEYGKGARYYVLHDVLYVKKGTFERQITVDSVTTKQDFTNIISIMKEAGERLRQIIAENKIVENWGKQKSNEYNEKDSKSIWIQTLSDISLLSMKEKINEELIKRGKLADEVIRRYIKGKRATRVRVNDVIYNPEEKSFQENVLYHLRKNCYQGDIGKVSKVINDFLNTKEVKVNTTVERGQIVKEEQIVKPECFGNPSYDKEKCYHCFKSTSCYKELKKENKSKIKKEEVKTIKI